MTAPDLSTRLLAAITEVEQREGIKVHLGLTEPSLLLSLCEAHREIVEQYMVTKLKLDSVTRRMLHEGEHDDRRQQERATLGMQLAALYRVLLALARAYGLNPDASSPVPEIQGSHGAHTDARGSREQREGPDGSGGGVQDFADERDHGA